MELYISTLGTNISRDKESFYIVNDEQKYIVPVNMKCKKMIKENVNF